MSAADVDPLVAACLQRLARRAPAVVVGALSARQQVQVTAGAGHLMLPDGPPPQASTFFEIGSVTKVFTSLLLAVAVTRGELTLDTPVRDLLPAATPVPSRDGRQITLEHLATHRSGLPRSPAPLLPTLRTVQQGANPYADLTVERLLDGLARARLRRPPGTGRPSYSNLGAGLLGVALVRAAGAASYGELVGRRISAPLGLADTGVLEEIRADPGRAERLAVGYGWRHRQVQHWALSGLAGAGALLSTATDLLTFLRAQLAPSSTPLADAIELTQRQRAGGKRFGLGLGWIRSDRWYAVALWHNGGTSGFRSFAGLLPERGCAVVVLTNSRSSPDGAAIRLLYAL